MFYFSFSETKLCIKALVVTVGDGCPGAVADVASPLVVDTFDRPTHITVALCMLALYHRRPSVRRYLHLRTGNARQFRTTAADHCSQFTHRQS